ncbi:hypothetical protein EX30DRAFT_341717 [Ascodesmis nigricans]|uniref:Uncharacterized protein n=1 Tax=Ascodesmis nigricans TaxID=341454 RepID=A0A4S2MUH4_9PEZI|nr:hypothetical protein EX30DRAFT_341717 [Ascodesmis nigricans]
MALHRTVDRSTSHPNVVTTTIYVPVSYQPHSFRLPVLLPPITISIVRNTTQRETTRPRVGPKIRASPSPSLL